MVDVKHVNLAGGTDMPGLEECCRGLKLRRAQEQLFELEGTETLAA